jgi:hypothetical protein
MKHRPLSFSLSLLALIGGCGGSSIVIGGDPNGEGGELVTGAAATGGANAGGAFPNGGVSVGGSFSAGGSLGVGGSSFGGTSTYGGASGAFTTGGSTAQGGTSVLTGGTSGSAGSDVGPGGEGNFDPYPRVFWEMGQGYRSSCPRWDDVWGFTCWNHQDSVSGSCSLDGSPFCNACSCAVPCGLEAECPESLSGFAARCLSAPMNVASCFVLCRDGTCPTGMTCSMHPGNGELVCVWVSDRVIN